MTTEAKATSNRRNAARSTGPRTSEGKEASSRNSLKHGLTKPPPYSQVMDWYRLITGSDSPPGLQPSRVEAAALALAEATPSVHSRLDGRAARQRFQNEARYIYGLSSLSCSITSPRVVTPLGQTVASMPRAGGPPPAARCRLIPGSRRGAMHASAGPRRAVPGRGSGGNGRTARGDPDGEGGGLRLHRGDCGGVPADHVRRLPLRDAPGAGALRADARLTGRAAPAPGTGQAAGASSKVAANFSKKLWESFFAVLWMRRLPSCASLPPMSALAV
jgi:hypothetical protein